MSPRSYLIIIGVDATHLSELQVYDLAKVINVNSNGFIRQAECTPNMFHDTLIVKCETEAEDSIVKILRQSLQSTVKCFELAEKYDPLFEFGAV